MPSAKMEHAVALVLAHSDDFAARAPLPDDAVLDHVAHESGLPLPDDYRTLVQRAGNVSLTKELLQPRADREGRLNLLSAIAEARASGVPAEWLPICRDNGDYYCLLPDGSVHLWSHGAMFQGQWSDLSDWVVDSFLNGN